ncbi:hypothetical protein AArcMg_1316 [Natrarchaeobaculum sulfurireducens]|uniref:Uncharacterized protein n=1 Tax=Natrarchaeobaculum sulfurireducens TaxID=2044521 RepID=A0A346PP87_9EURY|nr:hypothetical protein AArcMg_1316 [Natrarchaeobaculum sulfurireducens]
MDRDLEFRNRLISRSIGRSYRSIEAVTARLAQQSRDRIADEVLAVEPRQLEEGVVDCQHPIVGVELKDAAVDRVDE